MRISLDDGKTWQTVTSLSVVKDLPGVGDVETAEVVFRFENDDVTTNVWVNDVCQGTSSETYVEMGDRLVDGV